MRADEGSTDEDMMRDAGCLQAPRHPARPASSTDDRRIHAESMGDIIDARVAFAEGAAHAERAAPATEAEEKAARFAEEAAHAKKAAPAAEAEDKAAALAEEAAHAEKAAPENEAEEQAGRFAEEAARVPSRTGSRSRREGRGTF